MPNDAKMNTTVASQYRVNYPSVYVYRPFVVTKLYKGFTLIELIVAMAAAAILVSIAMPSLREFILNIRLSTQTSSLASDIALARNTAATRPARVLICTSSDGLLCDGSGWNSGRLIFWETQPFGTGPTATNTVRFTEPPPANIQSSAPTTFPDPLIFDSRGSPITALGAPLSTDPALVMPITFTLCDVDRRVIGRQVFMNAVGQATIAPYTCP